VPLYTQQIADPSCANSNALNWLRQRSLVGSMTGGIPVKADRTSAAPAALAPPKTRDSSARRRAADERPNDLVTANPDLRPLGDGSTAS